MNTGNYTILGLLFVALFASIAQETNAQESSELSEQMRRWLREQMIEIDAQPLRPQPQPQQRFLQIPQIPQIQHQLRQQEMLRVSPTTRLPSYLDRLPISDSTNLHLLHRMNHNFAPDVLNRLALNLPPAAPNRFVPERIGIRNVLASEGNSITLPCPDIRRAQRQRDLLRSMGIEPLPTRLSITDMYEINERVNQLRHEAANEDEDH